MNKEMKKWIKNGRNKKYIHPCVVISILFLLVLVSIPICSSLPLTSTDDEESNDDDDLKKVN